MLSEVLLFLSQYLTLCGDIQLMLAQNANNRAAHLEEFNYQTKEDQEILHSLHRESSCQGGRRGPEFLPGVGSGRKGAEVLVLDAALCPLFLSFNVEHGPVCVYKCFCSVL